MNTFSTITDADWKRGIEQARARRQPQAVRARIFRGPACPVCGRPGLHRDLTGGTEIVHSETMERCWWPSASVRPDAACGHVTTDRREAA